MKGGEFVPFLPVNCYNTLIATVKINFRFVISVLSSIETRMYTV
jgi:hypothetical protein